VSEAELLRKIEELRSSEVSEIVKRRMEEFRRTGRGSEEEIFKELCFCILTANFQAQKCIEIQRVVGEGFLRLPQKDLEEELRKLGHRYAKKRAEFIVEARRHLGKLKKILEMDETDSREWLVKNVRGLGYKEASHFLRNVGKMNVAIIDRHILNVLSEFLGVERPKSLTKKRYLELEEILRRLAEEIEMTPGELDLYLWYMKTGRVLK